MKMIKIKSSKFIVNDNGTITIKKKIDSISI